MSTSPVKFYNRAKRDINFHKKEIKEANPKLYILFSQAKNNHTAPEIRDYLLLLLMCLRQIMQNKKIITQLISFFSTVSCAVCLHHTVEL